MNKRWLKVIERAINSQENYFALNNSWQEIYNEYAIGQLINGKINLTATDKQQLKELVRCQLGINLNQHRISDLNNLHRDQALTITHNEKLAGLAVKRERLAIKHLANQSLNINQQSYTIPAFSHLDIALENIQQVEHDCILVVENYRCFDQLAQLQIQLDARFRQPLVVYRGDKDYSCTQLLKQLRLPVLAMTDCDPAGLIIAQSLPYAVALVAPTLTVLESFLLNKQMANPNLYTRQLAQCRHALESSEYAKIREFWQLLNHYQAGVVQEHWLNYNIQLFIHEW